jgi:hypothetical protein
MTCRELLAIEHPDKVYDSIPCGSISCPELFGYSKNRLCEISNEKPGGSTICTKCWNQPADEKAVERVLKNTSIIKACEYQNQKRMDEITESMFESDDEPAIYPDMDYVETLDGARIEIDNTPHILDSGDRTEFPSGAVRDMRVGKGRCDLLPLDVVATQLDNASHCPDGVLMSIYSFQKHGDERSLYTALSSFCITREWDDPTMLLEVAKHFEEGAKKYGDNNWQKGIPVNCYIDSAVRHYLKYLRGDQDEPHDRAFCWNILCCIWTVKHIEEAANENS